MSFNREKDPAYNCLAGTADDISCPVCGSHAWKRYGQHQNIACRKCGKQIVTRAQKRALMMFLSVFFTVWFTIFITVGYVLLFK